MSAEPSAGAKALTVGVALLVVLGLIGGIMAYRQVPEGHEGVEKHWGAVTGNSLDSGPHWKVPIQTSIQDVEVRPRTYTMSNTVGEGQKQDADAITVKTVNGSSVDVDVTVRYHIREGEAPEFVEEWKNLQQMEKRLIRPTVRSDLRDTASELQTTGEDAIYTQEGRTELAETARQSLREQFEGQPIVLEAVQIRNIDLPDKIDSTLDEKEQAKQQVQVEQERIEQERAKAEQKRVEAQADADVIEIRGEALRQNKIVLDQQAIEAMDEGTVYIVPQGQDSPPMILNTQTGGVENTTSVPGSPDDGSPSAP